MIPLSMGSKVFRRLTMNLFLNNLKVRKVKMFRMNLNLLHCHTLLVWHAVSHDQRDWRIQAYVSIALSIQRSIASKGATRMIRSPSLTPMGDGMRFVTDVSLIQIQHNPWLPSYLKRRLGCGLSISRNTIESQASDVVSLVTTILACWITSLSIVSPLSLSCVFLRPFALTFANVASSNQDSGSSVRIVMLVPIQPASNRMEVTAFCFVSDPGLNCSFELCT